MTLTNEQLYSAWFEVEDEVMVQVGGPEKLVTELEKRGFTYDHAKDTWVDPDGRTWDDNRGVWVAAS